MDLPDDLRFRNMTRGDLDRVLEIESGSRPGAWQRKDFWSKLNDPRVRGTVMEVERDLCGFSIIAIDGLAFTLVDVLVRIEAPDAEPRTRMLKPSAWV